MLCSRSDAQDGRRHVALVGFAGAGKSTVGKLLAKHLGMTFVDLDADISKKAGRTISAIVREHGEVGFRAHERAVLRETLQSPTPLVIATGGATFVDASMRGWVQRVARTVYLRASPEVLCARIAAKNGRAVRQLRAGPDQLVTVKRLLAERSLAYEQSDITVSCDKVSCEAVVDEVLVLLRHGASTRKEGASRLPEPTSVSRSRGLSAGADTTTKSGLSRRRAVDAISSSREPVCAVSAPELVGRSVSNVTAETNEDSEGTTSLPGGGTVSDNGVALLRVHAATGSYPVELRPDAGPWLAEAICTVAHGERIAVISDTTVARLHGEALVESLRSLGKLVSLHTFAPGEGSKTLATAARLYDELLVVGLSRADLVVAVGGGVVGDVAGFVASTFLRGVDFFQVPTTTLAAVDSSVGGKTGVNTERGKNLVGTFHAPRAVGIAASYLATQSRRQHVAGLVEAVKMAAALDAGVLASIAQNASTLRDFDAGAVSRAVAQAVALKAGVVSRDERESGERAVLNYGHTIGHAIETGESYRLLHGEAVALGMMAEAEWAEQAGAAKDVAAPLRQTLEALGAPWDWRQSKIDSAAMQLDKKRQEGGVRMPIVTRLGTYELKTVPLNDLLHFIEHRSS